ncbi:hypothetical protein ACFXPI_36980 [Streptomyces sp. NPDC059104]|uniref:hypothetical protein n=1 Tax=Streptomyces sp. NPDC059104 TaxID=3346729 RepID=UPI0036BE6E89
MESPRPTTALPAPARPRPVTPTAATAGLLVPVLAALGVVGSYCVQVIHGDWVDRQQAACRHLPFPEAEHVAGWAGLALGLSAVIVYVLLARRLRRRHSVRLRETWPGLLAFVSVWLDVPAVLLELFMVWAMRTPDGSGSVLGDCG